MPAPAKQSKANTTLTTVGSMPKYSAIPPHTPNIILSSDKRSFFNFKYD